MNQLGLPGVTTDLEAFFEHIEDCRDKNGLTHGLHPFPAKFIPHIPRILIAAYSRPGALVLDPMCGSGTTLLEALVQGRHAVGVDVNPVAVLVSRAKTTALDSAQLERASGLANECLSLAEELERAPSALLVLSGDVELPEFHNREHWFSPPVTQELGVLRGRILGETDDGVKQLALACFSAIVVGVSNQESETTWRRRESRVSPGTAARRLGMRLAEAARRVAAFSNVADGECRVERGDARDLREHVAAGSVELVVTSPPYANAHDYYLYNKLRLFWLGEDFREVQRQEFGSRNEHSDRKMGIESYLSAMSDVFRECGRVLAHGGRACLLVGDAVIRGEEFRMDELLVKCTPVGLELEEKYSFEHKRFNALFQKGFGIARGKTTHVLIFRSVAAGS